jgi:hypothetical protein
VDRPRRRFPRQAPTVTVEFEPEILFDLFFQFFPPSNYTRLADSRREQGLML